jgi:hypothetical protein
VARSFRVQKPMLVTLGARVQGAHGARVRGAQGARVQGAQGARVQGAQGARVQGAQGARVQGAQGARVQGARVQGAQGATVRGAGLRGGPGPRRGPTRRRWARCGGRRDNCARCGRSRRRPGWADPARRRPSQCEGDRSCRRGSSLRSTRRHDTTGHSCARMITRVAARSVSPSVADGRTGACDDPWGRHQPPRPRCNRHPASRPSRRPRGSAARTWTRCPLRIRSAVCMPHSVARKNLAIDLAIS